MGEAMRVLFLAAEAAPYSKVGGLADFAGELPAALRSLGVDVRLMIPRYASTSTPSPTRHVGHSIPVPVGPSEEPAYVLEVPSSVVPTYLVSNEQYFSSRERIYGFNDDGQRFVYFSRAVIAALGTLGWSPDIVHANDWHTAPVPAWLDTYGAQLPAYREIASVFTAHSLAYQGIYGRLLLSFGGMSKLPHLPAEQPGKVNWVAQGIAHADLVNTVSPTYADEMRSGELDPALAELVRDRGDRFLGILSGIDTKVWDPSSDAALTQTYDLGSLKLRSVNKTALQRELQLPVGPAIPLLGLVSRLDRTKGLEILAESVTELLGERECQFALLGTGEPVYEAQLKDLQTRFPRNFRAICRFDERLARRFYAGLDLHIVPSLSEPRSTGTLLAMRYGAIPLVRNVGGLHDAVADVRHNVSAGTGFSFDAYSSGALSSTLRAALAMREADPAAWLALQRHVMSVDHCWQTVARAYVELYERSRALHKRRQ